MNGYEIFRKSMILMGISEGEQSAYDGEKTVKIALSALQNICTDLDIKVPENLTENLNISGNTAEAVIYGVAMLMGLSFGDTAANSVFAGIYSSKRAKVKASGSKIADVLPFDDGGM